MNVPEHERWVGVLASLAHLRNQAFAALDDLREHEDRTDANWRALWAHWQCELIELRQCEEAARAALRALTEQAREAA